MLRNLIIIGLAGLLSACGSPEQQAEPEPQAESESATSLRSAAPADARIFFANLEDGAALSSPFTVEFGLEGMDVVPAGTEQEFSGHHHLLIDQAELPVLDMPIPSGSVHVHFGKGQTSVDLDLPQGTHTLQLILGNHLHIPHDPPVVSEKITITVE